MPFEAEKARIDKAEFGLQELREVTNTTVVLDNNRLVDIAGQLPLEQAFAVANELVSTMVKGIVETITLPSLINLDYADVSAVMKSGGMSVIGIGESDAADRVTEAVKQALTHPLLDVDYKGASGALIHVTCGPDLKLEEFDVIGRTVSENLNQDAQVIIGARISKDFVGKVRVITIMTGVKSPYVLGRDMEEERVPMSREMSEWGIDIIG
jgi:cell division protein FtsZ